MNESFFVHRYLLKSAGRANRLTSGRKFPGALVRIGSGFACVHPWPQLGDLPLEQQLGLLKEGGKMTSLLGRAKVCAGLDGAARERGVSLFDGVEIPRSHWLWNSGVNKDEQIQTLISGGFQAVKIKCDGSKNDARLLAAIVESLPDTVQLRPDLNAALDPNSASRWFSDLPTDVRTRIDFIEDPMPYDPETWSRHEAEIGCDFAMDRTLDPASHGGFHWRIIKPAVDDPDEIAAHYKDVGLVFTSYLDHPLGQLFAAYCATGAEESRVGVCGLTSHLWFDGNPFAEALAVEDGGRLVAPAGSGLGFDDLLENLRWDRL